ncbi:MAG: redox-regulated ATPase YchF [Dethiobacter sp.]|jgi:GTP-binding protein YchF|nr:redox-regulated ATPase YchF [Dethiobacter sp.]
MNKIMQIGLVGLPRAGKTTFFNLLTDFNLPTVYNPAAEPHAGSATVPDQRVDFLAALYKPRKIVHARIAFTDIPGARINESGARAALLLNEVRVADLLVQVVRAFPCSDGGVSLPAGPQPHRDLLDYATELILADMDAVEKRIERIKNRPKIKKDDLGQLAVLERLLKALEQEQPLSDIKLAPNEQEYLAGQAFLSNKPLIAAINIDEDQFAAGDYRERDQVIAYAQRHEIPLIEICAQAEMEIGRLSPEDRAQFMAELGSVETGLERLVRSAYERLGLLSFFTVGDDEVRAWTVRCGVTARQAAGKIHSDIERGFIRAEVFHFDDLCRLGSAAKVREAGLFRLEGKDYLVRDGDIISIRFNV